MCHTSTQGRTLKEKLVIFVGVGANVPSLSHGSPLATCSAAIGVLDARGVIVIGRSRWYVSAPVPPSDQPDYINGVLQVDTRMPPDVLLRVLHGVEGAFGRCRGERNAVRTLDLDLLAYGNVTNDSSAAVELPHPRMHERAFVLRPLADLAPWWRHPRLGLTTLEMLEALPPGQVALPIEDEPAHEKGHQLCFSPPALS
jgi:2-amino-4-hydroxy-6-hydroxymethyldihydropteridine diphosphokinase